jgi:predicted RNase H-like HicB family nuclease
MPDATHYTYRVAWSPEDGEHVATVAEFPSLSWLAPTQVEALRGIADVVRDVLADLAAVGEPIPEPLSERTYSGRFVVRVPAEVHRRLAREAAEQHVSLNRLVSDRLARALSRARAISADMRWPLPVAHNGRSVGALRSTRVSRRRRVATFRPAPRISLIRLVRRDAASRLSPWRSI